MPHSTILTAPASYRIAIWAALPGLGAVIGWVVLTFRDDWLAQDWLPMRGPVLLIDRVADWLGPAAPVVLIGLGLAAGVLLALTAAGEEVTLTVTDDRVSIARAGSLRHHRRVDVREALLEGSHLVLVAENGTELARVRTEIPHAALAAAFAAHGYTWAA